MEKRKVALITGVTGQDGGFLVELLLDKGYIVFGIVKRSSSLNTKRVVNHSGDSRFELLYGDLTDYGTCVSILRQVKPDELYNLEAQSSVALSFVMPEYTALVDALGPLRLLEGIRAAGLEKKTRMYQASSSELFGKQEGGKPQNEKTNFHPTSPYAVAKLYGYWIVVNYREAYGIYAVNGILFNHESENRPETFVTRKITMSAAQIKLGTLDCLSLGNLDAKRDWGHARDFVEAMWLMLQQEKPDDFCVATGETHSVREFCEHAFAHLGMYIVWKGDRGTVNEYGVDKNTGKVIIKVDKDFFRPLEGQVMWGDPTKIEKALGWKRKVTFAGLCETMVKSDYDICLKRMKDPNVGSERQLTE
jgi:GDPmannose 4,6-dehydratase